MVDLDKFICSMIWHSTSDGLIRQCLKDQGLEYKDGALKPIKKGVKLKEGKWYVFTHASLFYDTINGEVVFKKDKPYRCLGEATLLGDGGDYCFGGQEDILKNLRPATDEEIKEIEKPATIKFNEPDIEEMVEEYKKKYEEALKRAKGFKTDEYRDVAEYIFPELRDSEDWECKDNSEELNEAARQIVPKVLSCEATAFYTEDDIVLSDEEECFKAGARWQKQHSKCPLDCPAFSDGYKIGMKEAKQQMMKDAFECKVKVDAGGYPYIPQMELYDYGKDIPLAKEGDKYKVILIKED